MALARGAALASANAPLFASSTAALAYALDPGTGEVGPRGLAPTYLDVSANADLGECVRAYSALDDDDVTPRRRRPMFLAGSALAAIGAVVAGVVLVSLTSDRPTSAVQHKPPVSAATPAKQVPAQVPSNPPEAQLPPPSPPPPPPEAQVAAPPAPPPEAQVAAPPPPPAELQTPHTTVIPPATPVHRAPTQRAPEYVPTPVQQAAPAPPPAAPPPPPPAAPPPPPPPPAGPPMTMYLRFPFVTVPIPIYPPPPPAPPPPPP